MDSLRLLTLGAVLIALSIALGRPFISVPLALSGAVMIGLGVIACVW